MSLIDRDKYRDFLEQYIKDLYDIDAPMIAGAVERCLQKLDSQPTLDAVEVIRCKDCEHWIPDNKPLPYCRWVQLFRDEDDFCSYGERRPA